MSQETARESRVGWADVKAWLGHLWWSGLSRRGRTIVLNVAFGLAAWGVLALAQRSPVLENARSVLLNWELGLFSGTSVDTNIALIDVDDATYFRWGSPAVTPRDKLCRLIDFAIRSRASAVLVDVDLRSRDPDAAGPGHAVTCDSHDDTDRRAPVSANDVLASYLGDYTRRCRAGRTACVPLIFAMTPIVRAWTSDDPRTRKPVFALEPSFVSAQVSGGNPAFVGSDGLGEDPDGVVRRLREFEQICVPHATALTSVVVLAVAAHNGRDLSAVQTAIARALEPICPPSRVAAGYGADPQLPIAVDIGGSRPLEITDTPWDREIVYRIPWSETGQAALTNRISARVITDGKPASRYHGDAFAHKIVVIGSSAPGNADLHRTPLGTMPGTILLLNAINALSHDDLVKPRSALAQTAFELGVIVVVSTLFAFGRALIAVLISVALVLLAGTALGIALLDSGSWLDPIAPLLGIGAHHVLSTLVHRDGMTDDASPPSAQTVEGDGDAMPAPPVGSSDLPAARGEVFDEG